MRFITFKNIEARNFLSFGDVPVNIDLRPGVNAITGTNFDKEDSKNGVGKSTIGDALFYSLYGTTLREVGKDFISNSITKKRCEVSLTFDVTSNNSTDTFKIVRKLNPTKCYLFKNGEDVTRSTLAKTNNFIQDLIRTPSTVFQNSVIMSANNALPFMALSKTDKRKFIESVLGLEVFTAMVLKARDDYSIIKKDYDVAYSKLETIEKELEFNQSQFDNYESLKQERLAKQKDKQTKLAEDIQTLKSKILDVSTSKLHEITTKLADIVEGIDHLEDSKNKFAIKIHKLETEIGSEHKQIKQLQTTKDNCPTCKRDYSAEHISHVQELISKHEETINDCENKIADLNSSITTINTQISALKTKHASLSLEKTTITNHISNNNNLQVSITHLENNLSDVLDEIQSINNEHNNDLKGKIADLTTSVNNCKDSVNVLNNQLNVLETVKFVISEEGIKSFIVKKILKVLNSRLAFYLKKLEANCLCQFNEFFDEEIVDESSQQKSYFNFSGGERKRIDLACLFAFADIRRLQGDVNFSTVFYDELLDSSLDDKGVLLTLKVLRERFQENNESCYIITHRGTHITTKSEHVIHAIKRNGITSISS
jgi:DNA repair exonuclease SbcCD ATPase subunit